MNLACHIHIGLGVQKARVTKNKMKIYEPKLVQVNDLIYNRLTTLAHVCLISKVSIFSVQISSEKHVSNPVLPAFNWGKYYIIIPLICNSVEQ